MALWAMRGAGLARRCAAVALVGILALTGCGKQSVPDQAGGSTEGGGAVANGDSKPAASSNASDDKIPPPQDGQHEPFDKVTRGGDDPPPNSNPPPDRTVSGKSVYKVYKEVTQLWDTIRFVTPDGKRLNYSVTVETDLGNIEIDLRPDLAPNHVRNFVALARAGYYDDLFFDRICHEEEEIEKDKVQVLDSIEAGCPLGTGEPGNGSIGYWLKPEFPKADAKVSHGPGTVGACHAIEADTAACRFYITLCDAPFLDGNFTVFGKVTQGLDVARKIAVQPIIVDDQDTEGSHRPEKPIKIRKVTIHTSVAEAGR
ncbi:MAG TPA: peptidylprolyl isomerase [Gemmataceae bacterium]|jgi:cyclophilin family peptidyl-prolyl cis-trans isomerase